MFGSNENPTCNDACYDQMCVNDANAIFKWAASDAKVAGVFPWLWDSLPNSVGSCKCEIGAMQQQKTVDTWTSLGPQIVSMAGPF